LSPAKNIPMDAGTALVTRAIAGAMGSAMIGALAYRLRALTRSGAWAATACGTVLYGAGGWPWAVLVGTFFVSSSALTRAESGKQHGRSADHEGRRWHQVAANAGIAALAACAHAASGSPLAFAAAAGAVAAATADTWATEVGRLSAASPVLITTGAKVPLGASGGITVQGTSGACAGALLVGWVGAAFWRHDPPAFAAAVALSGLAGTMFDSLLGATIETRWTWVGNGIVNFAATAWGALTAMALVRWWA